MGWLEFCREGAQAGHLGPLSLAAGYQVVQSGYKRGCYALSLGPAGNWETGANFHVIDVNDRNC